MIKKRSPKAKQTMKDKREGKQREGQQPLRKIVKNGNVEEVKGIDPQGRQKPLQFCQ